MSATQETNDDSGNDHLTDEWVVFDLTNDNQRIADSRSKANDMVDTIRDLSGDDVETQVYPPGESVPVTVAEARGDAPAVDDDQPDADRQESDSAPTAPSQGDAPTAADKMDGEPTQPEVIDAGDADPDPATTVEAEAEKLEERSVDEDPLAWLPGEFIDEIDGSAAINRKGFEVLSHFYDVSVNPTLEVPPEETDHEYCRVRCVATMPDGREVAAYGSAHVDRGDDKVLLLEMADTRARKRALSVATGVGAVAVEEIRNDTRGA